MLITSSEIERYRGGLGKIASAAKDYMEGYVKAFAAEYPSASVAEIREAAKLGINDALYAFGDQAATLACDFFDEIMEAEGVSATSKLYDAIDRAFVDEKVRYYAKDLADGKVSAFTGNVSALTEYYIKRSAYENIVRNCERNDVRYARVPSGRETCSFCFMLCSRGFVYHSRATAEHGMHKGCDCIAVPGYVGLDWGTQIEGYNPDGMYERWSRCRRTLGGEKGIKADWEALPSGKRAEYESKYAGNAYKMYERNRTMREVETRDWNWLYEGRACSVKKEPGAKPLDKELAVSRLAADSGLEVLHIKAENKTGVKTADAKLNGVVYEYKVPEGWSADGGEHTVRKQFFRAAGKGTSKLVLSNCANGADFDRMASLAGKTLASGDYPYIDEVLVVGADGSTRRFKA